jgi:hypothetical protein
VWVDDNGPTTNGRDALSDGYASHVRQFGMLFWISQETSRGSFAKAVYLRGFGRFVTDL